MYLLAKLHPHLKEAEKKDYKGPWLNTEAKKEIMTRFYRDKKRVPLSIDHRDLGPMGLVKPENVVGEVCDLFLDKDSELILKCKLSNKHKDGYQEINSGIFRERQTPMGVSVGLANVPDGIGGIKSRHLVHVALTKTPGFGQYNTFITHAGLEEKAINKVILEKYADGGASLSKLFVMGGLKDKLEGSSKAHRTLPLPQPQTMDKTQQLQENAQSLDAENNIQTEEVKEEMNEDDGPMTLAQKRAKLQRWNEHLLADPSSFFSMPLETREAYMTLEKEIKVETNKGNEFVISLCDEKKLSQKNRETVLELLGANSPKSAALTNFMVDFVGANIMKHEEAERKYLALEIELANEKKRGEQESFNNNAKRLRSQATMSSAVSQNHAQPKQLGWSNSPSTAVVKSSNNNNNNTSSVAIQSLPEQFNFLTNEGTVRKTERVYHEGLNDAVNPLKNGYQRPNEYTTQSAAMYAIFQDFGDRCDQALSDISLNKKVNFSS